MMKPLKTKISTKPIWISCFTLGISLVFGVALIAVAVIYNYSLKDIANFLGIPFLLLVATNIVNLFVLVSSVRALKTSIETNDALIRINFKKRFAIKTAEEPPSKIADVYSEQTLPERLLRCGTVCVRIEKGKIYRIRNVIDAHEFSDCLSRYVSSNKEEG